FSSRRRHTRFSRDWSSDVCSSDLHAYGGARGIFSNRASSDDNYFRWRNTGNTTENDTASVVSRTQEFSSDKHDCTSCNFAHCPYYGHATHLVFDKFIGETGDLLLRHRLQYFCPHRAELNCRDNGLPLVHEFDFLKRRWFNFQNDVCLIDFLG